jgi:pimeloyl-ACP methyl ester carboxylesterase
MKRWEVLVAIAGAVLLALGAHWIRRGELPRRDFVLQAGNCHVPVTSFSPLTSDAPAGSVIILHGLAANRRVMSYLGEDFAGHGFNTFLFDLSGHGDNTDAFSFASVENCAAAAVSALMRRDSLDAKRTILLGHSMGGMIAIRMADKIPIAATVVISPAPMVLPRRMPANLLVYSAQFDVWQLRNQALALQLAAGGDRSAPDDFAQQRAFALVQVPLATHTSMLDDRAVTHRSELWAMQAIFPQADAKTLALNLDLGTYGTFNNARTRLAGAIAGLLGIALLLPLCIAGAAKAAGSAAVSYAETPKALHSVLITFVAAMAAVLLLMAGSPLRFLHIYAGDYLMTVLLIVAIALLALNRGAARAIFFLPPRQLLVAAVLAVASFLAIGAWFNWELADLWLNAPRWLRFLELLPLAAIVSYAEETVLGPVRSGKSRALRFGLFLALRLEIWLVLLFAFFVLGSGQILLPILVVQFGAFSVCQRLATDAFLGRTGSAAAAALFGAILAAWFVAAVFPLT